MVITRKTLEGDGIEYILIKEQICGHVGWDSLGATEVERWLMFEVQEILILSWVM